MTDLPWIEQNVVDELVGALHAVTSYCEFRPDSRKAIVEAIGARISGAERGLMLDLTVELRRRLTTLGEDPP